MKISFLVAALLSIAACSSSSFNGESDEGQAQASQDTIESNEQDPQSSNLEPERIASIDEDQSPESETMTVVDIALETSPEGIVGGHFDLDTSSVVYPFNAGDTDGHVHQYDDKYQINGVNFFDIRDTKLQNVQTVLQPVQNFYIKVVNANLSPAAVIEINGIMFKVADYAAGNNWSEKKFSLTAKDGLIQLKSLSLRFPKDAILQNGLIGTETGCVRSNTPGKQQEYRNGALLFQVIDADNYTIDPVMGYATSGLLWEASVFWHHENGCYL